VKVPIAPGLTISAETGGIADDGHRARTGKNADETRLPAASARLPLMPAVPAGRAVGDGGLHRRENGLVSHDTTVEYVGQRMTAAAAIAPGRSHVGSRSDGHDPDGRSLVGHRFAAASSQPGTVTILRARHVGVVTAQVAIIGGVTGSRGGDRQQKKTSGSAIRNQAMRGAVRISVSRSLAR